MEGWPRPERRIASLLVVLALAAAVGALNLFRDLGASGYVLAGSLAVGTGLLVGDALVRLRRTRRLHARHAEDLEALVGSAALLQGETDGHRVGGLVARLALSTLHGEAARVLLPDESDQTFFVAAEDPLGGVPPDVDSMASEAERALVDGRIRERALEGGRAILFVPLVGTRRTYGVAAVVRGPGGRQAEPLSRQTARLFGYLAGRALERLRVIERLRNAAMRDPLTGAGSRRLVPVLLEDLEEEDALLLLDVDRFKSVNDEDGHIAGDAVLASLGGYLQERLRDEDEVARYGGDEFLLALRGAGAGATGAAERLAEGWRSLAPRATFSVGVAVHRSGDRPETTLRRADEALYRAKECGRDRVSSVPGREEEDRRGPRPVERE